MFLSQVFQYVPPGRSISTSGINRLLPVCIKVTASYPSSIVPNPPGKRAMASECRRKINLRVKKYLKVISFLSCWMIGLAACSQGRRMLAPKLFSGPAPSWPACMMPGPAPVMTMKPAAVILRANSTACLYSVLLGCVRAEPKMVTLRVWE